MIQETPISNSNYFLPHREGRGWVSLLSPSDKALWLQLLSAARHIVITCHRGPDGDAIGSTTALASWLRRHYPEADIRVVAPTIFPDFLKWMPGAEDILIYEKHEDEVRPIIEHSDLVILCDHGELKRMWTLGDVVRDHPTPRIMIDHHLDPEQGIADLVISHPDLSSTCEVLLRVILELEPLLADGCPASSLPLLTHDEAVSLYTGMMTDTGAFTYASTRPEIYELISILLQHGIDKDKIYRNVFFTYSPNRLKLQGYMLYAKLDVWKKAHTSIMTFTNAERRRFGTLNGDTEGLVNLPLQILGMKLSIFLREDTEHPCIRVSLRSVDDFPCNEMAAEFFGGGGHKNAAGGEIWGTMDDAVAIAKKAVQKFLPLLKE
ncbi:MAG: bifunctional oligoribonuclease/PAP phosphatase NrnA [Bacteroidaceae bacterium]|nr:bifunctional oligoribonuclease/PAP phosphatase NrnA [Bacteroidaceae bacterium]